jgi:PhnB protein
MDESVLTERLDQAIEALLRNPNAPAETDDAQVAELLGVAAELCDLPRAEFKAALRSELKEASMSPATSATQSVSEPAESKGKPPRARFRTITPYLTVADIHQEIEFITQAFGAQGTIYGLGSAGGFHSEYKIGDSMVMIGGGGKGSAWKGSPTPAALHIYVEDVDVVYQRALEAGGTSLYAPMDQDYGDRDAAVRDAGGNEWYIGTHQGADYRPADTPDLMPYLHPQGAPAMIDFLKQAFNAEAVAVHQSPDGIVRHATVKIGDSILEMGEAHGQWQPMPMTFMLYVENVDNWYARAMKAEGAISINSPADHSYGDRMGAVKDPFGNTWYIGQHLTTNEDTTAR